MCLEPWTNCVAQVYNRRVKGRRVDEEFASPAALREEGEGATTDFVALRLRVLAHEPDARALIEARKQQACLRCDMPYIYLYI